MNKIGIIAGSGNLPVIAAKNATDEGLEVYTIAFNNYTDKEIEKYSITKFFNLGSISKPIEFLKENGVDSLVMLGTIPHINVFRDLRPDLRAMKFFVKLRNKTPLSILNAIADELLSDGIKVIDSTVFLKNLIIGKGVVCGSVSDERIKEIEYGYNIAKKIAELDIGLSVVIKDYSVIAVEAIEGTDECIKRAGLLLDDKNGFILVKVARPHQDFRFDLPVIGERTIKNLSEAGGDIIAIESGTTLLVDKEKSIEIANKLNVSIIGI
ncbi:MAG: UDP-2,3-diacylglucosamine diphosphatase LpxI [Elusimicrobiales bacterium]|jgi:DUF1009 family protein|nr:UDP-2,3-diacylglucosamine diphosphatase LpxI [Elusimicrobiales bacterium]